MLLYVPVQRHPSRLSFFQHILLQLCSFYLCFRWELFFIIYNFAWSFSIPFLLYSTSVPAFRGSLPVKCFLCIPNWINYQSFQYCSNSLLQTSIYDYGSPTVKPEIHKPGWHQPLQANNNSFLGQSTNSTKQNLQNCWCNQKL